jgi:hypothetical protein
MSDFALPDMEEDHPAMMRLNRDSRPSRDFTLDLGCDGLRPHYFRISHSP